MTIEQAIDAMHGTPAKLCCDAVFVFGAEVMKCVEDNL